MILRDSFVARSLATYTDLPSPNPSSDLSPAVPPECSHPGGQGSNRWRGSRSLTHLSARLTVRADDGHATPLSASGKPFRLTVILLSPLVKCLALNPIEPQPPPLEVLPRQFP